MNIRFFLALCLALVCSASAARAVEKADIIVAQDGSGRFTSIQDAVNSVPKSNTKLVTILVKKGIYREKIYIQKSNLAIVGEDRDSTSIVYPELRSMWREKHNGDDWGTAVINIDSTVTDITLANLTVHNNYGTLYGVHDHQFAIYGNGTRIIILNCNIIADGGDTLSLWNRPAGMYYHANCYFEGWVDYVCPRGWCYITDSKFFGHNLSASIWHDGNTNKKQKFVIRRSSFDGVEGFPLGRNHRDGQIFLLDCIFSRAMADRPIYWPASTNSGPWKWGDRHYYYNCHREGGDFGWFADNLKDAEGSPAPEEITAAWTFDNRWDPESALPSVLPFVSFPSPRTGSYGVKAKNVVLKWTPSRNAESHNIYFVKGDKCSSPAEPVFVRNQKETVFNAGSLEHNAIYYWRVDEIAGRDTIPGPVWHFTVQ
jgi:pectinesterase